jgi:hypothetical protein
MGLLVGLGQYYLHYLSLLIIANIVVGKQKGKRCSAKDPSWKDDGRGGNEYLKSL